MSRSLTISTIAHWAVVFFSLLNVVVLLWYLFFGYQEYFHSDSAAKVLMAREIVETGNYFPSEWNYVNSDLWVLFGHTFIIPLLAFLPAGYLVHAISGVVSTVLVLSAGWLLAGVLGATHTARVATIAVLAGGISAFMAENLYGQASYGSVFYLSSFLIVLAWGFIQAHTKWRTALGAGLALVLTLVFWENPQRAALSYAIPLLATVLVRITANWRISPDVKLGSGIEARLVGLVVVSAVAGVVFHYITLEGLNNVIGAGHARWLSYELMLRNISQLPKGYLAAFGGLPSPDVPVVSRGGAYQAARLLVALALAPLMAKSLVSALRTHGSGAQFVGSFVTTSLLLVSLIQTATTVPDMNDPIQSFRYLVPALLLLFVVWLTRVLPFRDMSVRDGVSLAVLVTMISSAYPNLVGADLGQAMSGGQPSQFRTGRRGLVAFLESNGLRYGYATYWNASVLSVLSNENVLVRPITLHRGRPMPFRHHSSNRWYEPDAWSGEVFLLLTESETVGVREELGRVGVYPARTLSYEGYEILVFPENLANRLAGWSISYRRKFIFPASIDSQRQVGAYLSNYQDKGGALVAESGETGYVHYGPYVGVASGSYLASFDVSSAEGSVVRIDVAVDQGRTVLAQKEVSALSGIVDLGFTLDKPSNAEFRVWSSGAGKVAFRSVSLVRCKASNCISD